MIVSWNWLKDYLKLDMTSKEVEHRLTMAGLNHEGSEKVGDDLSIDLEVTSNRADCLGHIGVAREIAVLWDLPLTIKDPRPNEGSQQAGDQVQVRIDCPELCQRYTARLIHGIKIAPSPGWLTRRLTTLGITPINNVVDITNYVLMECAQPLHAFDFDHINGRQIIVRESQKGEQFKAIDHRTYPLDPGMCVIADAQKPVALGGVMGGADSEVSGSTTNLLIEAALFQPLSIRNTARRLNLHSPSSYRFERGTDPAGVDWASRRCCEMILDLAGGKLSAGVVDVGPKTPEREPIVLRISQLKRILGIDVPTEEVRRILQALGGKEIEFSGEAVKTLPPSWRRDLTREIDLIEEVARIHGYDKIPENASVPMVPSHRMHEDRVREQVRHVLSAAGFDEAMTVSVVSEDWSSAFSPWTDFDPIQCSTPMLRGADRLRRSLIPSLLGVRHTNQSLANPTVEIFETAKIYLPGKEILPTEEMMLGLTSGEDFHYVKGVAEGLITHLSPGSVLTVVETEHEILDSIKSCQLLLDGMVCGYLGELSPVGLKRFGLRSGATVAELSLAVLCDKAQLIAQHREQSSYPSISRDLNLIADEKILWAQVATTVRQAGGEHLDQIEYRETYRDPNQKDGPGKKRLLFSLKIRSEERTLTSEEADTIRDTIVAACTKQHGTKLLG